MSIGAFQFNGRGCHPNLTTRYLHSAQLVKFGWAFQLVSKKRLQIGVGDVLLLVSHILEAFEGFLQLFVTQLVAQVSQPHFEGVASAVLAQHEAAFRQPD